MNSFSQLNTHGGQKVLVDDSRPANIILDKTELTDLDQTFDLYPNNSSQAFGPKKYGVNIEEIINYATANARLTATIFPSNMVTTYNASLVFNVVSPVTLSKPAANIYQLTGFQNDIDWENNISFTFNYPQTYKNLTLWYVTFVLDWYDESSGQAKSITWDFYNTGHYYIALLPSKFNFKPKLSIVKRSKANFVSSFQFKKSVQTSANLLGAFALRGFIELRLMKRSSAQLITPVTFSVDGKLRKMVRTTSNVASNFALIQSETQPRIRKPPARLLTGFIFRGKQFITRRVSPNLISRSLIANPRSFVTRRTASNQTNTAILYSNNLMDVWDVVDTRNFSYSNIKSVTASQNNIYYLTNDNGISVYNWDGDFVGSARPPSTINANPVNVNFESIRASDNVLFAFARNLSVPFEGVGDYLIKYVPDQYGNYRQTEVIEMDALGLATHDVGLNGKFAYQIRASRMQPNQSGYRIITSHNYISITDSSDRLYGLSISGNWLHIITYSSSTSDLTHKKYLLSGGYYGLHSTTVIDSSFYSGGLSEYGNSVANNATGGWYSYNDQIFGIGRILNQNSFNNFPPYGIYNPYDATSTLPTTPWPTQALNKYATKNLSIVADANNNLSIYTNLNNSIVDVKPNANATEWPNRFSFTNDLSFNPDYVFASPDGNYLMYASTTQSITFKKR
jgi:hypothetical protein